MAISILIVDDHAKVRRVIRQCLEEQGDFTIAGEAGNGRDGVALAAALQPDVILMDVSMPEMDGIEATRLICQQSPQAHVLILSTFNSAENCSRALQSGAQGYFLKETGPEEMATAIRAMIAGCRYFGAGVSIPSGWQAGAGKTITGGS